MHLSWRYFYGTRVTKCLGWWMRRLVVLAFSPCFFFFSFFHCGLIDIWPIFHSGPSVLRVLQCSLSPTYETPLHWLGVSSYPPNPHSYAKAHVSWLMIL